MKLLRLNQVMERTGLGRSSIYNYMSTGEFPKPVKIGPRVSAWVESEVEDWIMERIEERDVVNVEEMAE
ncbi:AlpA family transcriptional regulator [Shewanella sp. Isolate11]|uniref:helix-turn-helix transcriptional regulator n=1 Tax=Shewanella sp. Isolate11 TaxID=2908530 RepID=UPI001EFCF106|nr:AlpA family transcriptional regulator [Shewanella sp. Isolate11]MCG9698020.1 AlpA family transcriptional regulator [Shewanella sp. Isolate11]